MVFSNWPGPRVIRHAQACRAVGSMHGGTMVAFSSIFASNTSFFAKFVREVCELPQV